MTQAVSVVQKISSVLVQAGGPGVTKSNANGLASQLQGLEQSLLGVANTTYLGQAIFAGTSGSPLAYSASSTGAVSYIGNTQQPTVAAAPNVELPTSITNPFGASASGGGGIFGAINQAISDLKSGNITTAAGTDLKAVQQQLSTLENQAAQAGVNDAQFQVMSNQVTGAVTQATNEVGSIQNVNTAKLTTQYQQQINNYQVALYTVSQLNQPTLAHYL
jgi:flagellar hook-associated protein 3 FlgL